MIDKDMLEAIGQLMDTRLAPMQEDISSLKDDVHSLKDDVQTLKDGVQSLKADNVRLIDLEKKVGLILEGQQGMNEKFAKLDAVADDVEDIKLTVRAMEAVTQRNSNDIQKLRAVK